MEKVPYMIILGENEANSGKVSIRKRSGEEIKVNFWGSPTEIAEGTEMRNVEMKSRMVMVGRLVLAGVLVAGAADIDVLLVPGGCHGVFTPEETPELTLVVSNRMDREVRLEAALEGVLPETVISWINAHSRA